MIGCKELMYWCLRKRNAPEKLARLVQITHRNSITVVGIPYEETAKFKIDVGLHQ